MNSATAQRLIWAPFLRIRTDFFYGYFIVAAAFLVLLVTFGSYYAFGVFFKPVISHFGWSRAVTSGAFSLACILKGLLGVAMGMLTDRFGPRIVTTISGVLVGLGYLLMPHIESLWHLYLFYGVLVGAGMGGAFVPLATTVARWFVLKRGLMTGIIVAGIGIGALAGPPLASQLISAHGWRESYSMLGVVILAVVVVSAQFIKRDPDQVGQRADGASSTTALASNPQAQTLAMKEAFSTTLFWLAAGMFLCFGFAHYSVMVHLVPHVMELGVSAGQAAGVLATIGGLSIIGKVLLGRLGDRVGSKKVFMIGILLMSVCLFCLIPAKTSWMLYGIAAVFGLAYGGVAASLSPLVAVLFGLGSHGFFLGILTFCVTLGGAIGPFWCGYVFDAAGSYRWALLTCAVISSIGLLLTLMLKPTGQATRA
jgi:MFS family permease